MRVLHVFGIMNRGGAELRTLSLADHMLKKDVKFDYCVLSGEVGVLDQEIVESGSNIHYCKLDIGFVWRFYSLLKSEHYDLVHSHVSLVSGIILLIAKVAGVHRKIAHFRNTDDKATVSWARKFRNRVLKTLLRFSADKILGVCKGALDGYWGDNWHQDPRFAVLYNGFAFNDVARTEKFWSHYIKGHALGPVVINIARMDYQKNHLRQTHIFHHFLKLQPNAFMVFIGKESTQVKDAMIAYAKQHHFEQQLVFLGEQANVLEFLANASVVLFPSMWEGLPGVVIEAAGVNTPVLASMIPGVEEIAAQLPIVEPYHLSQSDSQWADKLNELVGTSINQEAHLEHFNRSDFLISTNVDKLYGHYCR